MSTIYEILKELESNNSRNFKMEVLRREESNTELLEFFKLALDKSINYYIKKIPKYSKQHTGTISLEEAMKSLNKLSSRMFTGNKAKFFVSKMLTGCTAKDAEVIIRILKRDPKCGTSISSVNKVWPNSINVWPCMLCNKSTAKNLANMKYPALNQEKSDGLRFNIVYVDGKVTSRSRSGKYMETHGVLDDQIEAMAALIPYDNFVIDGEGLIGKYEHKNTPSFFWSKYSESDIFEDRQTGNGIFNKAIQNTITKEDAERIRLKVWDIIPYEEFITGKGTVPYKNRVAILKNVLKHAQEEVTKIGLTLTAYIKSKDQAIAFYKQMISLGKEGAILKNIDSFWEDKRSKDQIKLKIVKQIDMVVVATIPHKKKKNCIGALTLESSCGRVRVNCGSGLKKKDIKLDPIKFMRKIVMMESNGLIESKGKDTYSLFLPIFKEIRIDKDEADSLEDIKDIFDNSLDID